MSVDPLTELHPALAFHGITNRCSKPNFSLNGWTYLVYSTLSSWPLYFIPELNFDFIVKITAIDEVSDGEIGVVEQIVEGLYQVQVFGQFLVKAFVPVGRRTIHTNEVFKIIGIRVVVSNQSERKEHTGVVQQVPS